tara:strand:- start:2 stop:676 length:675 start_codon:yes stop_codon:yes gene_type:complete
MNNYNLEDLYKDPRMTRLTSDLNDANSKQKYNRAEQIEDKICRLSDHYQEEKMKNTNKTTNACGVTEYRLNGELHREDGPAVEYADEPGQWYLHGKLHREDGPAESMDNGHWWYLHGKLHREGGPAIEQLLPFGEDTKMEEWYLHGELHREDGPALDDGDGQREWWLDGKRHCVTGPAIEHADGYEEWWINGEEVDGPEDVVDYHLAQNVYCFYNRETDCLEFE